MFVSDIISKKNIAWFKKIKNSFKYNEIKKKIKFIMYFTEHKVLQNFKQRISINI